MSPMPVTEAAAPKNESHIGEQKVKFLVSLYGKACSFGTLLNICKFDMFQPEEDMDLAKLFCTICNDTLLSKNMARHRRAKYHVYMKKKRASENKSIKYLKIIRAHMFEFDWCFKDDVARNFFVTLLKDRGYKFA